VQATGAWVICRSSEETTMPFLVSLFAIKKEYFENSKNYISVAKRFKHFFHTIHHKKMSSSKILDKKCSEWHTNCFSKC